VVQSEVELSNEEQAQLQTELLALAASKDLPIQDLLFHESIPVDLRHQARIQRRQLAVWAESKF